jgi:hypothetical protein
MGRTVLLIPVFKRTRGEAINAEHVERLKIRSPLRKINILIPLGSELFEM